MKDKINKFDTLESLSKDKEPVFGRFSLTFYNDSKEVKLHDRGGEEKSMTLKDAESLSRILVNMLETIKDDD